MKQSRGNYPGKAKFYAGTSKDDLTPCLSFDDKMPFFKKKVDGYVKDEYKTGVEVNYYESEFITINPEVPNGNYWMYNVSLDELELYGY